MVRRDEDQEFPLHIVVTLPATVQEPQRRAPQRLARLTNGLPETLVHLRDAPVAARTAAIIGHGKGRLARGLLRPLAQLPACGTPRIRARTTWERLGRQVFLVATDKKRPARGIA